MLKDWDVSIFLSEHRRWAYTASGRSSAVTLTGWAGTPESALDEASKDILEHETIQAAEVQRYVVQVDLNIGSTSATKVVE